MASWISIDVSPEMGGARLKAAKQIATSILQHLQRSQPYHHMGAGSMQASTHSPQFLNNFSKALEIVGSLEVIAKPPSVGLAIETVVQARRRLLRHNSMQSLVHLVLIMGSDEEELKVMPSLFSSILRVHAVILSSEDGLSGAGQLRDLCQATGGMYLSINVEGPFGALLIEESTKSLLTSHFLPFATSIVFGSLTSTVTLEPSPLSLAGWEDKGLRQPWPKIIQVFGFVKIKDVGAPAVLSTHTVLAGEEESSTVTLRGLLASALRSNESAGLVQVGEDWFGLLYPSQDGGKERLMISFFPPSLCPAWLAPRGLQGISSHIIRSAALPTEPEAEAAFMRSFELPKHCAGFLKSEAILAEDVQKIAELMRALPEKKKKLLTELNRLRTYLLTYQLISWLDKVETVLSEQSSAGQSALAYSLLLQWRTKRTVAEEMEDVSV